MTGLPVKNRMRPLRMRPWRTLPLHVFIVVFLATTAITATRAHAEIRMLFFGDVMVGRRIETIIQEYGIPHFFTDVTVLPDGRSIHDFHLVSANLEGAVTDGGRHFPPVYPYDFAFPPERIAALTEAGITYFSIANNHLYDQGEIGVESTRRLLSELEIAYSGDVDSVVGDYSVTTVEVAGFTVALVGLSEVYRPLDRNAVIALLEEVEPTVDLMVVNIHWGVEYEHLPRKHQRDMAIILSRAGADMIIGHHPHVTQGIEFVGNVPVFYSLGNFIFDQAFSEEVRQGYAVAVVWDVQKGFVTGSIDLHPYRADSYVPYWLADDERNRRLSQLAEWSFGTPELKGQIRAGRIVLKTPFNARVHALLAE